MPKCQACGEQWSWFGALKVSFKRLTGKKCATCGEIQYPTYRDIKVGMVGILIIMTLILLRTTFDISSVTTVTSGLLLAAIFILIIPYSVQLSNKHEPLW
ncbi:TIGR04104 family putative zinc finger protein [Alkalibacillus haloalkaliphilus]|uniref:TIGR04104 family putative zinc finger protein n=1 Tax=Alkalibacillus haloalkaliphilus TaxID=94136 RepID=UPI0003757283|nr:TIGR04104 family putative zinc finger protein [Alkalibacillus haloalkaliphilus]